MHLRCSLACLLGASFQDLFTIDQFASSYFYFIYQPLRRQQLYRNRGLEGFSLLPNKIPLYMIFMILKNELIFYRWVNKSVQVNVQITYVCSKIVYSIEGLTGLSFVLKELAPYSKSCIWLLVTCLKMIRFLLKC